VASGDAPERGSTVDLLRLLGRRHDRWKGYAGCQRH
jgi:hypothetical protein